jgi:hypothetical protein
MLDCITVSLVSPLGCFDPVSIESDCNSPGRVNTDNQSIPNMPELSGITPILIGNGWIINYPHNLLSRVTLEFSLI